MPNIEDEIVEALNRILQLTVQIDVNPNYSQQDKDKSKMIFSKALDYAVEELSKKKINQLVYNEYKKKKTEKLKDE